MASVDLAAVSEELKQAEEAHVDALDWQLKAEKAKKCRFERAKSEAAAASDKVVESACERIARNDQEYLSLWDNENACIVKTERAKIAVSFLQRKFDMFMMLAKKA